MIHPIAGQASAALGSVQAQPGRIVLGWSGPLGGGGAPVSHLPLIGVCAPLLLSGRVSLPPPATYFAPGDP